ALLATRMHEFLLLAVTHVRCDVVHLLLVEAGADVTSIPTELPLVKPMAERWRSDSWCLHLPADRGANLVLRDYPWRLVADQPDEAFVRMVRMVATLRRARDARRGGSEE